MIDYPYLIALALIEQEEKRYMPIGGKSLPSEICVDSDPGEIGSKIAQQVLLRVLEKSQTNPIKRAYGEKSLLIIQVPMALMQEHIPLIKANWIASGDSERFIEDLKCLCNGIWSMSFSRDKGTYFSIVH